LGEWARRRGYQGPLEIIPNGVDTQYFAKAQDHFAIRKALNVREDETVLITSSRLVHKNGVDTLLRAVALLPKVHCLILGSGSEEEALKKLSAELGVDERVYFVGQIPHTQLPSYLQAATIFVRPSRSEGMGNSFIEAFAAGVPVIGTQEGGIADFLFDAEKNPDKEPTGWAVDKDNPAEIVAAVEQILLGDPAETKRVIENARTLAFKKYDWDLIAQQMKERVFSKI
jgi:glycosyltransferase involved in cell wall biosynthesis